MIKTKRFGLGLACGALLLVSSALEGADLKTYQVTGPVLEVTPTTIVVKKGEDRWEISRSAKTKVTGDVKVGSKVTIYYSMVATEIEVKEGKAKK
jgi:hypothetical protein